MQEATASKANPSRSRWVFRVGVPALAAFTSVLASNAAVDMMMSAVITGAWLLLGIWWLVLLWRWVRSGRPSGSTRIDLGMAPIVVILTAALLFSGYPLRWRFKASQEALHQVATAHLHEEPLSHPIRAGWYEVSNVETVDGEVRIYVGRAYIFDTWGFTYAPDGSLGSESEVRHRHLEGPWYTFVEHHGS